MLKNIIVPAVALCMLVRRDYRHILRLCNIYCFPRHQWLSNLTTMLRLYVNCLPSFALVFAIRAVLSTLRRKFSHAMYKNVYILNIFPPNILIIRNNLQQTIH
jgi:hypothetical protein